MPERLENLTKTAKNQTPPHKRPMRFFRLLESVHTEKDWDATPPEGTDAAGSPIVEGRNWRRPGLVYGKGEVVKSPHDLVTMFGATKFQEVSGPARPVPIHPPASTSSSVAPVSPTDPNQRATVEGSILPGGTASAPVGVHPVTPTTRNLEAEYAPQGYDRMSVEELKEVAEAEEIDLGPATRKADIINVLRAQKKTTAG